MIDKKEIKEILDNSFLNEANVSLCLFENKKTKRDPLSLYMLNIDQNIVDQVKKLSNEYIKFILNVFEKESIKSIPIYNPDNEQIIFKIDSQKVELYNQLFKHITDEIPHKIYKQEDIRDDKLKSWIFRFEVDIDGSIQQILFFQRFQTSKMLGTKHITITLFQDDKEFKLLSNDVLNLNLTMDFLLYRNTFIVTKMSSFEAIFGYEKFYKSNASDLIKELNEGKIEGLNCNIKFSDIESIINKIEESTRFAHKLYSARLNGYYKELGYNKLVDLNKRYNLALNLDDNNNEWNIDEESDLQVMARILNDDYERSQLTDNEYIAISKERI